MTVNCYVNGKILPLEEATVSVNDLGLQRAYGVFDYGRTYDGKLFHFEENIARFRRSASELHLEVPGSDQEIRNVVEELIESCDLKIPSIRMMLTGGVDPDLSKPTLIIIPEELPVYPDEMYEKGIRVMTVEFQRELPHIKSLNYLNAIRLEPLRKAKGVDDIVYHSVFGITECPRNNFYAFKGNSLVTAEEWVLHGVTRGVVLRLAEDVFEVERRQIYFDEIADFDEAFTTSTTKGIMPITEIDGAPVGDGKVGKRTRRLMQVFQDYLGRGNF